MILLLALLLPKPVPYQETYCYQKEIHKNLRWCSMYVDGSMGVFRARETSVLEPTPHLLDWRVIACYWLEEDGKVNLPDQWGIFNSGLTSDPS